MNVNMWVARPALTTVNVTGLPAFNARLGRHRTFPAYARVESTMASWLFPWT